MYAQSNTLKTACLALGLVFSLFGCNGSDDPDPEPTVNPTPVTPAPTPVQGSYPVVLKDISAIQEQVTIEYNVPIIMRDGTRLAANVFRPAAAGEYPVVMALTSYGKDTGPDNYPKVLDTWVMPEFDHGNFEISEWTSWEAPDPAFWVPNGYVVVMVDSRGFGGSEGDASVLSPKDALDFHDAIEWAAAQGWSNGNVGTIGVSYLAIAQYVTAVVNPPSLKAIIPWEGQTDSLREVLFHGGVPETSFTNFWLHRVNGLAHTPPLPEWSQFSLALRSPQLMQNFIPGVAVDFSKIQVPALISATWTDQGLHTRGSFEAFKNISSDQKWLYTHGRPKWDAFYGEEELAMQLRFFDHFLKHEDSGMEQVGSVRVEVREDRNTYSVRYEDDWPIPGTDYQALYLDASTQSLGMQQPANEAEVTYSPVASSASFSYQFSEDTELTGNMKLRLWVSTDKPVAPGLKADMDLFVGVKKLDANGNEVYFSGKGGYTQAPAALGWLRVSERHLDEEKSTPWQPVLTHSNPQFLELGEIVPVDIEILPSSTLFRAGETIQLVVQGADLFKIPTMAHDYSNETNTGIHTIHTGDGYDSHLLIPVIH